MKQAGWASGEPIASVAKRAVKKVTNHVKKHKETYIGGATAAGTVGTAYGVNKR